MQTTVTVPSIDRTQEIVQFRFVPGQKTATVIYKENGEQKSAIADFSDLVTNATSTQRTTLKQFFKRVGALGLDAANESVGVDVNETDITGELFDES